ncbi:hypothetical protein ACFSUI_24360 [Ralstonia solanacearum]
MDRLLLGQILACLGELAGGGPLTEQRIAADPAVAANLEAHPFYRRWLRESLRLLARQGHLDDEGRLLTALPLPRHCGRSGMRQATPGAGMTTCARSCGWWKPAPGRCRPFCAASSRPPR